MTNGRHRKLQSVGIVSLEAAGNEQAGMSLDVDATGMIKIGVRNGGSVLATLFWEGGSVTHIEADGETRFESAGGEETDGPRL
jgi:hypothetical protein